MSDTPTQIGNPWNQQPASEGPEEIGDSWHLHIPSEAQRSLWIPQRAVDLDFEHSLLPPDTEGHGTGLLLPPTDIIAPSALTVPRIRAMMEQGSPDAADNSLFVEGTYDQGQTPECSSHSAVGILSAMKRKQHGPGNWWRFDPHLLFREGGGTSQGGIMQSMDSVLDNVGGLRVDDQRRYKEMSWAQVPNTPGVWEETVCSALATGGFIHQAMLLNQGFGSATNGPMTSGYHAVFLTGYRKQPKLQFRIKNSWGDGFGQQGFCWIDADYLTQQNFQNQYAYSLTLVDATDSGIDITPPPGPGSAVQQILDLTNQARAAAGLGPLKLQSQLMRAAQGYSVQLESGIPFSHTGPDGSTPFSRMHAEGYTGPFMGENIAKGFSTPQDVFNAWMNSPGHRANILYAQYTQIGIGVSGSSWVQDFGAGGSDDGGPVPPPPPPPPPVPVDGPQITGFSPSSVPIGGAVRITGSGFGFRGFAVFSPGILAIPVSWSDTEINCKVPTGATTGPIGVNAGGKEAFSAQNITITGGGPTPPPDLLPIDGNLTGQVGTHSITGPVHLAPRNDGQYDITGAVRTH